ncbi:MAG: PaaI family thioesterase [Acidimicrobiia bacterium]
MAGGDLQGEALIEFLRQSFTLTPLHQLLALRMVPSDGEAVVVEMPVREEAFNQSGNLHGGAIATLIDVACGSTAARSSSFEPGRNTIVTADLHVRYLGRPKGDVVRAEARLLRAGRQLVVVECQVLDTFDNVIAAADFSAMVVPLREPLRPSDKADVRAPDL